MRVTFHNGRRLSPSQLPLLSSASSSPSPISISIPKVLLLLLLLLPLLASCVVITESSSSSSLSGGSQGASVEEALRDSDAAAAASAIPLPPQARPAVGTKYAPVDGQDGKPHMGAFVEVSSSRSGAGSASEDGVDGADAGTGAEANADAGVNEGLASEASAAEPTSLKRLSEEMASKDGTTDGLPVSIPESNDGVMDDKNRVGPKQGTTGTEGGVSGKSLSSLEAKVPHAPKEAPGSVVRGEDMKVVDVVGEGEGIGEVSEEQGKGVGGLEVHRNMKFCRLNLHS